jgi:hypothetical protein
MNNQKKRDNSYQPEHQEEQEFSSAKVNIQPSEIDKAASKTQNQTDDPGRTPGKAEGSRETVEEDLREKQKK